MPSKLFMNGLSGCASRYSIVASDYDGADLIEEIKTEISSVFDDGSSDQIPVPIYTVAGSIGDVRAEVMLLYVYNGVPFILDPNICIEGGSANDARMLSGNRIISAMYSRNNTRTYSIGYVDSPSDAYQYAVNFTRTTPLVKDELISDDVATSYLLSSTNTPLGWIRRQGGSSFDVYAFNNTESALIRTDKDFIGGEPFEQNNIHRGKYEVILYGGDPDIVPIGSVCGSEGTMFTVWVPNDADFVECGTRMISNGDIDISPLCIDYDDLHAAYRMYVEKLIFDEQRADEESSAGDVPDIDPDDLLGDEESEIDAI